MIDFGGRLDTRLMLLTASSRVGSGSRPRAAESIAGRSDVFDLLLGILHGQHIVVAGLRIDPKARRDHLVRCQRRDHVVHHFFLSRGPARWRACGRCRAAAPDNRDPAGCKHRPRRASAESAAARSSASVVALLACSMPATCTSIGAGRPMFSTASTRPPDWKIGAQLRQLLSRCAVLHSRHVLIAAACGLPSGSPARRRYAWPELVV